MELFVDTSFFVAFLSPRESLHEHATEYMLYVPEHIVTTEWVMAELGNFLSDSTMRAEFKRLVELFRAELRFQLLDADGVSFRRGCELYDDRPDKDWSFTDCTSFVVMTELQLTQALTTDHHFEQAGFHALLR